MAAQNWADYFCSKFGGTPHQESENMIRKLEGTRDVKGTYMAKTKLQQMCRSQGIDGQLVGLEESHGTSLEPLDKHFQNHGLIDLWNPESIQTGKHNLLRLTHDVLWIDLCDPQRPMQIVRKIRK